MQIDVAAIYALCGAAALLIAGGAAWGVLRNRVVNLATGLKEANERMDRLESALAEAVNVGHKVDLLAQRTQASHDALKEAAKAQETLLGEKMDGVRGEVRSFMQGQASGRLGHRNSSSPKQA